MYRPTMSSSFSTNFGSREILKPCTRCGFRPLACQWHIKVLGRAPTVHGQAATLSPRARYTHDLKHRPRPAEHIQGIHPRDGPLQWLGRLTLSSQEIG